MPNTDTLQLRDDLEAVKRNIRLLQGQKDTLELGINHIVLDLNNSLAEFVASSGLGPDEYYPWRKRAKAALANRRKNLERAERELAKAMEEQNRINMLILSHESGYRGEGTLGLLRALYHFTMYVLQETKYVPDKGDVGLISTVQMHCGYAVPGGDDGD